MNEHDQDADVPEFIGAHEGVPAFEGPTMAEIEQPGEQVEESEIAEDQGRHVRQGGVAQSPSEVVDEVNINIDAPLTPDRALAAVVAADLELGEAHAALTAAQLDFRKADREARERVNSFCVGLNPMTAEANARDFIASSQAERAEIAARYPDRPDSVSFLKRLETWGSRGTAEDAVRKNFRRGGYRRGGYPRSMLGMSVKPPSEQ